MPPIPGPHARGFALLLGALALALAVAACATTRQTRSVDESGFLGDYSQLRKGEKGEAQLIYINPKADWARYDSVILDSVTLWHNEDISKVSPEDRQMLTDHLYVSLHDQLGKDYQIVNVPGPTAMRVRVALTDAKGAKAVANTVTSVVPQLRLLTTVGGLAADSSVLVAKAAIEVEILDSLTYTQLAAAVDERAGTKAIRGGVGTWSGVKNAFDFWAERLRERLEEAREGDA